MERVRRWWWLVWVVLLPPACLGLGAGSQPDGAVTSPCDAAPPGAEETLRLLTWNVHYGAGSTRKMGRASSRAETLAHLDAIARAIRAWGPHLVALQEVDRDAFRSHGVDIFEHLADATGLRCTAWTDTWDVGWVPYPGLWPGRHIGRVRSGQGVLSAVPLGEAARHALPQVAGRPLVNRFSHHRALLETSLEWGGRTVRLFDVHLEAFDDDTRARHLEIFARKATGPDTIVLGDLNVADATIEGLRHAIPPSIKQASPTSWNTFPATEPAESLDHVLLGAGIELASARVPALEAPPSDHLPVLVEVRLRPTRALRAR